MPTLNANRVGKGFGPGSSTFSTARGGNASSVTDNPTGGDQFAIQKFFSAGRGGGTYRFRRIFIHFDTSGISSIPTAATVNVRGHSAGSSADVILVKSTAMSGDGSTALASSEFFSSIDYSAGYMTSAYVNWNTSANNAFPIKPTGRTDIGNNNNFTVAIVEFSSDYSNNATGGSTLDAGVDFSTTIYLDYTLPVTSDITSLNGITRASITSFNTIALANINQINGIDN